MKIGRKRQHKVQLKPYETVDLVIWVEIDTESDADQKELESSGADGWHDFLDKFLDDGLAEDVPRAVGSAENETHLSRFYPDPE